VVPNGMDLPVPDGKRHALTAGPDRRRIALFLSRIHPVKGLPMLIEAWARLRPAGWELHIAGPDESGHLLHVQAQIKAGGLSDSVRILGPVSAAQKSTVFAQADLFVLPTHSENFGMVIAEALAHGVPVLTTKGAPWPMLTDRRCGWWVEANAEGIADGLMAATSCAPAELCAMGQRGRALIQEQFGWPRIGERFVTLYEDLLR
jgi:glycosyltransferase involved in cell wall biosynthesis